MVCRYHHQTHYPNNDDHYSYMHLYGYSYFTGEVVYPVLLHHFLKSLHTKMLSSEQQTHSLHSHS